MEQGLITITAQPANLTATGWKVGRLSKADWVAAWSFLDKVNNGHQWWLGDLWNAGQWGDKAKVAKEHGYDPKTAQQCGWVADAIQFSRRRENLSFSLHAEVVGVEDEDMQDALLDWAEATGATVRELREQVRIALTPPAEEEDEEEEAEDNEESAEDEEPTEEDTEDKDEDEDEEVEGDGESLSPAAVSMIYTHAFNPIEALLASPLSAEEMYRLMPEYTLGKLEKIGEAIDYLSKLQEELLNDERTKN